ncbi:endonuclease/exonuclease/phosphatase family protein [Roseicyclus mahoneyensis]|uniref:Endonuclease/exonuclease/phosphatase family metal-dependent hydrolase n=1 Tax=Roseicyclus mahoneyensis TaxID=164332 RepID=A0A316GQP0_9RHOB|nr:endonuclease/exonuclease/phosphatase family protein [Roseicyclus mahoneyensis]PWK62938.1 endonuclease/exonuclease/phosphatase family metal-dependent hydrolase [Roseicyclus mahoneyensis]
MTTTAAEFSCVSWNIHRGRGNDGVIDPARTARVLREEVATGAPDALILQEADEDCPPHRGFLDLQRVTRDTGLVPVHTDGTHRWGAQSHGFLGTIVFLHPDARVEDVTLIDLPGHCHRGAVIVDFINEGRALRLVGLHLSLAQGLRVAQMRTLGQHLFRREARVTVLAGDLNEWRPWGGLALSRRVTGLPLSGPAHATFPVRRPFLPLDRVLVTPPARVIACEVLDGPGIRMASDHRPLRATIALPR